ncbi:MAG: DUF4097 family beta strand repeat-containing protein [Candidatus Bipolaricaulaceae bacterium]
MRRGRLVREFPGTEPLRVEIVGGASDVSLRAHGEPKVRVELSYEVHGWGRVTEEREQALLARPPLSFSHGVLRAGPEPEGISLDYVLLLPPEAEVEVEVGSGDVEAFGLSRKLRVVSGSGDILLRDLAGEVRIRCGSGDIALSRVFGALSLRTGSGDIEGEEIKGDVDLETGSGDVVLTGLEGNLRVLTGSGDVQVGGTLAEGTWRIRTSSGDVRLVFSEPLEAEIFLRADFGDIACDFPLVSEELREGRLAGRIGKMPKARVSVETSAGDIALTKC